MDKPVDGEVFKRKRGRPRKVVMEGDVDGELDEGKRFRELAKKFANSKDFWGIIQKRAKKGCLKSLEYILYYGLGKPSDAMPHRFDENDSPAAVRKRIMLIESQLRGGVVVKPAAVLSEKRSEFIEPDPETSDEGAVS